VLDPKASPVIHDLFVLRASGASWRGCCRRLDERLPRLSGGHWTVSTVTSIIKNKTYLGVRLSGYG
jgi:hypothetical protein